MMTTRKLTRRSVVPVVRWLGDWKASMYSLNTSGSKFYSFTLDWYDNHRSWRGGFDWHKDDISEQYYIELETGDVFETEGHRRLFNLAEMV